MRNSSDAPNYPLKDIEVPHAHDVLCGRGGLSNNHVGNTHWRMLIAANKSLYVSLRKSHKMLLSKSIVCAIRGQSPPGRFLQKDTKSETWYDIGDHKAQEKTSQALREGAADIRSQMTPDIVGAANDPYPTMTMTPQSYIPPTQVGNKVFSPIGSRPDAMHPPVDPGPYMVNAVPMGAQGPYTAYPPMYTHPRMPPPYYPPQMPPAQYIDTRQFYPNGSPPKIVFTGSANETKLDTLQLPTLDAVPSPTENSTAAEITPTSSQRSPETGKVEDATDNDDDKTEPETPDIVPSNGQEPSTFGSLETLRLESMAISSFATKFESADTSFARMSFSLLPDPVDGGLETFASLSLKETPPRRRSPLTKRASAKELPCKQRSPGGLLEDSEDEDESGATTTDPPSKTADWEKMRAVFDLKQHEKTASAAAPLDNGARIPAAAPLDADISSGAMSTFSIFSARGAHDENSAPVPAPSTRSPNSLSEREKLEMEYLNRGVSLACEDFGMHPAM